MFERNYGFIIASFMHWFQVWWQSSVLHLKNPQRHWAKNTNGWISSIDTEQKCQTTFFENMPSYEGTKTAIYLKIRSKMLLLWCWLEMSHYWIGQFKLFFKEFLFTLWQKIVFHIANNMKIRSNDFILHKLTFFMNIFWLIVIHSCDRLEIDPCRLCFY